MRQPTAFPLPVKAIDPWHPTGLRQPCEAIQVEPNRKLSWRGKLIIPGLFDRLHSFTIDPVNDNSVRFRQREEFSGLIFPLLAKVMNTKVVHEFELMNQALKVRAESSEIMSVI